MGATTFVSKRHAPTAQEAFDGLVAAALAALGDEGSSTAGAGLKLR